MSNATTSDNPSLFAIFTGSQQSPLLITLYGARWLTAAIGAAFNSALVYVTITNKSLHGTCNLFIATQSFFEVLTMVSFTYSFSLALTGQNFISLGQCVPTLFWASFANLMRKLALFLVSLDRLLAVSVPRLGGRPITFYCTCLTICSLYSAYMIYFSWTINVRPEYSQKWVTCTVSDLTNSNVVGSFPLASSVAIVGAAALNYLLLWAILKWRTGDNSGNAKASLQYTRRIYKTLLAVTVLAVFGWMLNPAIRLLYPTFNLTTMQEFYLSVTLTCITNSAMLLDPVILFWFSKDYRNAYNGTFRSWFM